eukprot:8751477-Ditylum_brightwellii.AAC.1
MLQSETKQHHYLYHLQQDLKNPSSGILSAAGIDHFMQAAIAIQQPRFQKLADHFKAMCTPVQLAYAEESLFDKNRIPYGRSGPRHWVTCHENSNLWYSYNAVV